MKLNFATKKNTKMKKATLVLIMAAGLFTTIFSSCHKSSPPQSTITYVNDSYTPMTVTINGASETIPAGSSGTFSGNVGSEANGSYSTAGTYGLTVSQGIADNFPQDAGDNTTESIDIPAEYFYLKAVNTYTAPTVSLIVNLGLTSQTSENMTIPNDGNTYGIGYYYGFSNTEFKAYYTDNTSLIINNVSIPNVANASYTISL